MAAERQTVGQWMASFFGKSEKVISEKLTTDEHNQFTAEAGELQSKISALEQEKETLTTEKTTLATEKATLAGEKTTLENKVTGLENKITGLENDKTGLQTKVTATETDRDKYKAWFQKQEGKGKELPENDATSQADPADMTSYNAHALEVFRKSRA